MLSKKNQMKLSDEELELERLLQATRERIEMLEQTSRVMKEQSNTLPPMERMRTMKQQRKLNVAITRGNTDNLKRDVRNNVLLLLLLIMAIVSASILAIKLLNQI